MKRRKKRIVAGTVAAVMIAGSILGNISPLIASETGGADVSVNESFNKEGLWLTEIYQNDVDRSVKNNSREKSGYESIRLYKSTTDLMEFVEITSTYDNPVNFNDTYEFVYNDTVQKVTTMDDNADVVIQPEEKVVLWNYRSDVTTTIPTEAEFREEMRIPDDAVVLKVTSGVNWGVTSTFSLKTKALRLRIRLIQWTDFRLNFQFPILEMKWKYTAICVSLHRDMYTQDSLMVL